MNHRRLFSRNPLLTLPLYAGTWWAIGGFEFLGRHLAGQTSFLVGYSSYTLVNLLVVFVILGVLKLEQEKWLAWLLLPLIALSHWFFAISQLKIFFGSPLWPLLYFSAVLVSGVGAAFGVLIGLWSGVRFQAILQLTIAIAMEVTFFACTTLIFPPLVQYPLIGLPLLAAGSGLVLGFWPGYAFGLLSSWRLITPEAQPADGLDDTLSLWADHLNTEIAELAAQGRNSQSINWTTLITLYDLIQGWIFDKVRLLFRRVIKR